MARDVDDTAHRTHSPVATDARVARRRLTGRDRFAILVVVWSVFGIAALNDAADRGAPSASFARASRL